MHNTTPPNGATAQPPQPEQSGCGHPASLLLRSAESGEPLYCEACDDKSGRRDAEQMEQEWQKRALAAEAKLAAQADDFLKAHALNELQELGYTVEGDLLNPPEHLHKLIEAAGHPLAARASLAAPQVVQGEVEREAFEVEWGKRWPGSFKPRGDGSYVSNWTQCAWEAWQARAALASATPPVEALTDAERLTWLTINFDCISMDVFEGRKRWYSKECAGGFDTLRAAIDASIRAGKGGE